MDFAVWKISAMASMRQNAQGWGFGVFRGAFAINPCEGVEINQRWLVSIWGSVLLRMDSSSEKEQGKREWQLQMRSLESRLSVHRTAGHWALAGRHLLEMSAGLNAVGK